MRSSSPATSTIRTGTVSKPASMAARWRRCPSRTTKPVRVGYTSMSFRTPRPAIVSTNSGPTRKSARMFEPACRSVGSISHRWPGWTAPIGSAATSADNTPVPVEDTAAGSSRRGFRPTACATSARSVRS